MNIFREDLEVKPEIKLKMPERKYMMNLNESSINPIQVLPEQMMKALQSVQLNRYVSGVTSQLKKQLATYVGYGITEEQIIFGNGVDEMLYFLFTAVRATPDSYALSLAPSYFDYHTYSGCVGLNMEFVDFYRDSKFSFSTAEYLQRLNHPLCKLGIICNPNNPTGHLIPETQILEILRHTDKLMLLDETYFEFSDVTHVHFLSEFSNIVIARSFSKSFSAAGLRFGYFISSEENIKYLSKVMPVFHLSILIQTLALEILNNKELFQENNRQCRKEKDRIRKRMQEKNVIVDETFTNFLTFSLGEKSDRFYHFLLDNDISLRPVGAHPILANHLRVTVSDEESNNAFLRALDSFLSLP